MMRFPFDLRSYQARLVIGVVVLILLTTLSAGVPAYWLTRTALERQTWSHVSSAEQATHSLLRAEQARLDSLLALLAERPTLHRLLDEATVAELPPYLRAFQIQGQLDILFLCPIQDAAADQDTTAAICPQPLPSGFQLYQEYPAVLSTRPIITDHASSPTMIAVAGRRLDEAFLRQLASATGVEQTILLPDGTRLVSSLGVAGLDGVMAGATVSGTNGRQLLSMDQSRYFTAHTPLPGGDGAAALLIEVALPVDELFATHARARAVLTLSTGLVALLGILLGIGAVRRLTDPLEQLTRAAEAMVFSPPETAERPSLATPVPQPSGPREVRTLAAALQRSQVSMMAALDDLAQAHAWLNNLVQSIVEGVVTLDDDGRVTFINERAAALAALPVEAAIGRAADEIFPVVDESGNRTSLQRLPLGGKQSVTLMPERLENTLPATQPGQRVVRRLSRAAPAPIEPVTVLEVTAARVRAPSGDEMQTALILRDISEEEALRHLRTYFLANITHEFRTPLSTLNASMELLMNEVDLSTEEIRELLSPIYLSLLSLQTLIDNLLESSSIEAGRFVVRRRPVDLNQVIASAVQVVQPLLERRGQTLSVSEPALLPPLLGDAARLTQVLINLLGNAGKYSPDRAPIELDVTQAAGRLRVAVIDRGPGIPRAERENLFRRYVRLHPNSGEQYGIGLGLNVVKTTVEAHQGRVGVDDNPAGGSIFWFDLPIDAGTI